MREHVSQRQDRLPVAFDGVVDFASEDISATLMRSNAGQDEHTVTPDAGRMAKKLSRARKQAASELFVCMSAKIWAEWLRFTRGAAANSDAHSSQAQSIKEYLENREPRSQAACR